MKNRFRKISLLLMAIMLLMVNLGVTNLVKTNSEKSKVNITIEALDSLSGTGILEVEYTLYSDQELTKEVTKGKTKYYVKDNQLTSSNIYVEFKNLDKRDYWLKESSSPKGYIIDVEIIHIKPQEENNLTFKFTKTKQYFEV